MSIFLRKSFITGAIYLAGVLVMFLTYSFLAFSSPGTFNSPDESSNYFFSRLFMENSNLKYPEYLNRLAPDLVHPRSVEVRGDFLVPGGFIGLSIIYGFLGKIFGADSIVFWTPLFAVVGLLAGTALIGKFWDKKIGYLSLFLLAANPIWWYESSRNMFANILFVSLVLLAAYFYFCEPLFKKHDFKIKLNHVLSGLFFGLAAVVRPVDLIPVAIAVLTIYIITKHCDFKKTAVAIASAFLVLLPFLIINFQTYGGVFQSGYRKIEQSITKSDAFVADQASAGFKIRPKQIIRNIYDYGWKLNPIFFGVCFLALLLFLVANRKSLFLKTNQNIWFWILVAVSLWLFIFYGSFGFRDNPDPKLATIGSSYLRYALPIVFLVTPFIANLFFTLSAGFKSASVKKIFLGCLALVWLILGFRFVFLSKYEGLLALKSTLKQYALERQEVIRLVPNNALIIADRADKYIFPERSVMYPLRSDSTYSSIIDLMKQTDVYYYGITLNKKDIKYVETSKLSGFVMFQKVADINENTLYKLVYAKP